MVSSKQVKKKVLSKVKSVKLGKKCQLRRTVLVSSLASTLASSMSRLSCAILAKSIILAKSMLVLA